jgi:AcrR family transcriptional regulator
MAKPARRTNPKPAAKKAVQKTGARSTPKRVGVPSKTAKNVIHIDGRDRRPWALASKERLLEAATEEIAAVGFERARLAEIAERAEMTPGSVYTWFANKEELFRAAAQVRSNAEFLGGMNLTGADWMLKVAATVPRNAGDAGPTAAQKLLVEAYYASWRDPAAREILKPRIREHYAMYRKIVDDAQADGAIADTIEAHTLACLLLAIPVGLSLISMAGVDRPEDTSWIDVFNRFEKSVR